jgi:hypothetical protein
MHAKMPASTSHSKQTSMASPGLFKGYGFMVPCVLQLQWLQQKHQVQLMTRTPDLHIHPTDKTS